MEDVLIVAIIVVGVVALVWLVLKYGNSPVNSESHHSYLNTPWTDTSHMWESTTTPIKDKDEK